VRALLEDDTVADVIAESREMIDRDMGKTVVK
jgi:hypothetical protein